jgi:hypothetical protein
VQPRVAADLQAGRDRSLLPRQVGDRSGAQPVRPDRAEHPDDEDHQQGGREPRQLPGQRPGKGPEAENCEHQTGDEQTGQDRER